MALRCHHVGCSDGEYFDSRCEYESATDQLESWVGIPYERTFEKIDEAEARNMIRTILRCYGGPPPVR